MHHIEQFMKTMRMIHRVLPKSIFNTESGITPLQLEALLYLHMHSKSTVSALGKHLQLSSSATAQLTDRLVKAGFIKRENNSQDRRSVILSLTLKGNRVFSQLHKVHMGKRKELFALMPEKDVEELTRIFESLHQKLGDEKNV
jgi:DNA-binding MarR family transcriptional regulator